jgi:anti-anti-sigma factor
MTEFTNGTFTVRPRGELDVASVELLEEAFAKARGHGVSRVVLDLAHVIFIDSTALAAILRARRSADLNACRFDVVKASGPVRRLLELCGVIPPSPAVA